MIETAFFDTNVLIYMYDQRVPEKQAIATELFGRYYAERRGILSTQVLQEFFVGITQKIAQVPVSQARALVVSYSQLHVVVVQPLHILQAIDIHTRLRIPFWDGLIVAAAKAAKATILFTEDFSHGRVYDGVRVQNPFRALLN